MALSAGTQLGPYEIQSPLGAGGMGEVYRARDTKLNRDVAIKVLLTTVANDPDRMARFGREAQLLASLNHPHIAQIYGLEEADGVHALVMELVEGPTLADRIAHGAIPLDEALAIAKQMAEALEAAHEQGIIHRDLKPANIKVRPDGTVKVLDFGLAKALDPAGASSASATMSPTLSLHATQLGIILGTAAYMSPEQAAGKPVDTRSDLWSFGVVLLEMLTGRAAFTGETVSHVLASVLKSDPDWTALPAETPVPVRRLLRRCLEKDRKRRLDSAVAARLEIDDALGAPVPETAASGAVPARRAAPMTIALALAGAALIAALVTSAVMRRRPPAAVLPSRFAITPPPTQPLRIDRFDRSLAISSDGRHIVYTLPTDGTGGPLMVRPIDQLDARQLAGIPIARSPFFSPDGRWIGFFTDTELKKVSIAGGPAITICRLSGGPRGATWSDSETIVFATSDPTTGLWRVPAGGGEPTALTTPNAAEREGDHVFPSLLPNGRGVLFTIAPPGQVEDSRVAIFDSTTGRPKTLIRGGSQGEYVETGHLLYAAAGTLRAVRFDLATLEVQSDPAPVVEQVSMAETGAANYAVSRSGTLVYAPGTATAQARSLVWVDRKGHEEAIKAPLRAYAIPRISPDGTRVALDIRDEENDIWIWDIARGVLRRLTYGAALDQMPVWSPDGRYVVFASNRAGAPNLYRQAVDGTGTIDRLTTSENAQFPSSIMADAAAMVGHENRKTSFDVVLFSLATSSSGASFGSQSPLSPSAVKALVQTPFIEHNAEISPDGRYLEYSSNESGRFEIYVRPYPQVDSGKWQVSTDGGSRGAWARNGQELFYIDRGTLMAVPVQTSGATFRWGNPVRVFDERPYAAPVIDRNYDVSPDGRRFLMLKENAAGRANAAAATMVVVLNWVEELKASVPGK